MTLKEYIKMQIESMEAFGIWRMEFVVYLDEHGKVVRNSSNTITFTISR
jgi:hypothetical protein